MILPNPFPVQRWHLQARVERPVHWPEYEGSALRGLWGHALRWLACATRMDHCTACPLQARCAYVALFEPAPPPGSRTYGDMSPPYVLEPAGGPRTLQVGQTYHFDLVLFGTALDHLPLVRQAWQRALQAPIGPARGAMAMQRMDCLQTHAPLVADPVPARLHVQLLTPLFVKRDGRPVSARHFTAADFAWAVVRRVAEVCELHLQRPTGLDFQALKAAAAALQWNDAHWHDHRFERWSNRQGRNTPLSGVLGHGVLSGNLAPLWPLLQLGQWLHAGGKTSFGLGRYQLHPV